MVVVFVVDGALLGFLGINVVETHVAVGLVHGFVASLLHGDEVFQTDIDAVDLRPDGLVVCVWRAPWGDLHGYLIFVVVVSEVGTDTHEHGKVLVFKRIILISGFRVDEHLQVFVGPQVEVGSFVDGASVTVHEVLDGHLKGLLVDAGGLCHADDAFLYDAGRDDIRHGHAAAVLVDADCRDVEGGFVGDVVGLIFARGLDALSIGAPFAFHEVEGGETEDDWLLEFGQEHTHEADA